MEPAPEDHAIRRSTTQTTAQQPAQPPPDLVTVAGRKVQLGSVIQRQARAVATHVRGEGAYKPFAMTW